MHRVYRGLALKTSLRKGVTYFTFIFGKLFNLLLHQSIVINRQQIHLETSEMFRRYVVRNTDRQFSVDVCWMWFILACCCGNHLTVNVYLDTVFGGIQKISNSLLKNFNTPSIFIRPSLLRSLKRHKTSGSTRMISAIKPGMTINLDNPRQSLATRWHFTDQNVDQTCSELLLRIVFPPGSVLMTSWSDKVILD